MSAPAPPITARVLFGGFTRLSKGLVGLLTAGYVLGLLAPSLVSIFALTPGKTIPFAWNLLTSGYFEQHLVSLVINSVAILFLGKIVEPLWGTKEFTKFIIFVNFFSAVGTFVILVLSYYFSVDERFLYEPISGCLAVSAGLLVALKQIMPDQELPAIKLRVKWLPSILVLVSTPTLFILDRPLLYLPLILLGTYVSWLYLRLYQVKSAEQGGMKGDPSEEFAFATFFPEFMRPVVGTFAAVLARLFCGRRSPSSSPDDVDFVNSGKPLPGSDPAEASRRRERGARALEERLAKAGLAPLAAPAGDAAEAEPSEAAAVNV